MNISHAPAGYTCPLCQIVKGEIPAQAQNIVFQDELATVFVAGKWWVRNPGHLIIVPNAHMENLYVLPTEIGYRIFELTQRSAIALRKGYPNCTGISLRQHNEPDGGQEAWHFHMHVVPRYPDDQYFDSPQPMHWANKTEAEIRAMTLKKVF